MPPSPPSSPTVSSALPTDPRRLLDACCGNPAAPTSPWLFSRSSASRRAILTCAATAPLASWPAGARAAPYAPLIEDLVVEQVPGAPIYYVLGHSGVPSKANEGHTSNAGFVVTDDGVVVFDTLGTPSLGYALLQRIKALTDNPVRHVVLSHYHADHIYGLQAFRDETNASILAQYKSLDYMASGNIDDEAAGPRLEQRREALAPWVNAETRIVLPEVVFRVAAEMRVGAHQFQLVYAGPAHSMSDLMMLVLPERVLFAGDIVQNGRIPFMASAAVNTRNWLAGLRQVAAFDPRFIIPGHGKPSASAAEAIAFTGEYIRFVRAAMGDAVAQWVEFDEAYKTVDWSGYRDMPAFAASNRGNAYRVFLELEAEALSAGNVSK